MKKEVKKQIARARHEMDATDQSLGRLASQIATLLRGKNKPTYQPHLDEGDIVIVKNIRSMKVTGKKATQEYRYRHTGYPGGIRATLVGHMLQKNPGKLLALAVEGMLPNTRLRNGMMKRLIIE